MCCKEYQTIKELQSIENDRDRLLREAFMIQERLGILHSFYPNLVITLVNIHTVDYQIIMHEIKKLKIFFKCIQLKSI